MPRKPYASSDCPECGNPKDKRSKLCSRCRSKRYAPSSSVEFIRDNINALSWAKMAAALGLSQSQVRGVAFRHGIVKSEKYRAEAIRRGRWDTTIDERYELAVDRRGDDECWGWTARTSHGYGVLSRNRKNVLAHRFSYEREYGTIPDGMHVCHRCDNPPCTNPKHLFLGTQAENMRDAANKGRTARGERHPHAKLTERQVSDIRKLYAGGLAKVRIAELFGVNSTTVHYVVTGHAWRHVAEGE